MTFYYYFTQKALDEATSDEDLKPEIIEKNLTYTTFKPKMAEGGQKIRSVSAKESNYFNILQSIAETFGGWLDIIIDRDKDGAVNGKYIAFRNELGDINYAGFKYGINLKDIKRTFESKQIVTKLIVKNNSNEFAPDGFCSIARAKTNPTGENYIYDF